MVKVTAPGMSLDASGTLAGALVFSKWKGRNYIRQHVIPSNPRSGGQVGIRAMFKYLTQIWDSRTPASKATWEDRADQGIYSPFNAFMSYNMKRWKNFLGFSFDDPALAAGTNAVWAPGSATAGVRQITISKAITTINDGMALGIHRALTTGFDIAFDNCIGIIVAHSVATWTFVDSPLEPDQYFYNFSAFTHEGLRELEDDEVDDTVV